MPRCGTPLVQIDTAEDRPEVVLSREEQEIAAAFRVKCHLVTGREHQPVGVKPRAVMRIVHPREQAAQSPAPRSGRSPVFRTRPLAIPRAAEGVGFSRGWAGLCGIFPFLLERRTGAERESACEGGETNPVAGIHGVLRVARKSRISAFSPRNASIEHESPWRRSAAAQPSKLMTRHG